MTSHKKAFTFIEIAIVIIVIGLLLAATLVGMKVLHQMRLRSVMTDITEFKQAVNTFYLRYNAMPGDINHAQDFWPQSYNWVVKTF